MLFFKYHIEHYARGSIEIIRHNSTITKSGLNLSVSDLPLLTKFLRKSPTPVIDDSRSKPELQPELFSNSEFDDYEAKFCDYNQFYSSLPSKTPLFARIDVLPSVPTDIRGVDAMVYMNIRKPRLTKDIPRVVSNLFFSLKFFPVEHHFSLFRKSNIAYTFTNKAGHKLNSKALEAVLNTYLGKYKSLNFFRENLQPLHTAFGRTRFRKLIKSSLHESLHKLVKLEQDVSRVSGIFRFSFSLVPTTSNDRATIQNDLDKAVKTILSNQTFRKKLLLAVHSSNSNKQDIAYLRKGVTKFNSIGERNVPGYYPKFPFIDDVKKLK